MKGASAARRAERDCNGWDDDNIQESDGGSHSERSTQRKRKERKERRREDRKRIGGEKTKNISTRDDRHATMSQLQGKVIRAILTKITGIGRGRTLPACLPACLPAAPNGQAATSATAATAAESLSLSGPRDRSDELTSQSSSGN